VVRKDRDNWLELAEEYPSALRAWLKAPKGVPPVFGSVLAVRGEEGHGRGRG